MTLKESQKLFKKYNNPTHVQRAPRGRASMREIIDMYAIAAVNLYGVITLDEFVEIFNQHHEMKTTAEEVKILLLPVILKNEYYCFFENYLVHYLLFQDFTQVGQIIDQQKNKPRFVPEAELFNAFCDEYFDDLGVWNQFSEYLLEILDHHPVAFPIAEEIQMITKYYFSIENINELLQEYQIPFQNQAQVEHFFEAIFEAANNTRIWLNNGFTPLQMRNWYEIESEQETETHQAMPIRQIGRNELCLCGSGKKYKKCCYLKEEAKTAQLTATEAELFYNTWYRLLQFINQKYELINPKLIKLDPKIQEDQRIHIVADQLWQHPESILEFIAADQTLSTEQRNLLQSWHDYHLPGNFILVYYQAEYAVLAHQVGESIIFFGVKGILNSISKIMQRPLPQMIATVLLPFNDKIVYASYISSHPVEYTEALKQVITNQLDDLMKRQEIVTSLRKKIN